MKNDEKRQNIQNVIKNDIQQSIIEIILQLRIIIWNKSSQLITDDINKKRRISFLCILNDYKIMIETTKLIYLF
jgi:hypothetical protein